MKRCLARGLLGAVLTAILAVGAARCVQAQGSDGRWWESVPGFGRSNTRPDRTSSEDTRRKPEPVDDLRADPIPLRSDTMIEALESAIQTYQNITTAGGFPLIPG